MVSNESIFTYFLRRLNVKFTVHYAENLYNEHPNKYNLLGLSNLLSFYNIPNRSFLLENRNDLISIKPPYITYVKGEFATVISIDKQMAVYYSNNRIVRLHTNKFIDICSGIVLLAKPSNDSKEPNYEYNLKRELSVNILNLFIPISFVTVFVLLCIHSEVYSNGFMSISLGINLLGLFLAVLLLLSHLKIKSQIGNKICSMFKHSDCNNISESNVASFFGISWCEYGCAYFLGNSLLILIFSEYTLWMSLINIIVLPYSFWSVWYQGFSAKQWCILCLFVQATLWSLFITNLTFKMISFPEISIISGIIIMLLYGIPLTTIHKITKLLLKSKSVTTIKQELNSFKANEKVFLTLLNEQPFHIISSDVSKIRFGNLHSNIQLTVLTNPHCNPCAKMHERIIDLLKKNNNLCIQYIFTSFSSELEVSARFLIAVHFQYSPSIRDTILKEWFEKGRYNKELFFAKYPVDFNDSFVIQEYHKHKAWGESKKLSYTPFVFINGYELPESYAIEDLIYFHSLKL